MKKKLYDYKFADNSTSLYMIALFLILPLYFNNDYINILESKTFIFVLITWIYLIAFVACIWLDSIFRAEKDRKLKTTSKKAQYKKEILPNKRLKQDIFFVIFLCAVIVSTLCSGDIVNAWYSAECKLFGARILILCCGMYYFISRGYKINKGVRISFVIGIGTVLMLTIMNLYGIDLLQMRDRLSEAQRELYLSTIGNVNILSNFICIFIPLFMGIFLYFQKRSERIACGILLYLGVMAGIATNSDSFFLGFGASILFFLWFSMTSEKEMIRYLTMCIICIVGIISLKLFNSISNYDYIWYELQNSLINDIPWVIFIIAIVIFILVLNKTKIEINWLKLRRVLFVFLGACAVGFAGYVIAVNTIEIEGASKYLIFNESWGTNRGFVWMHTCEMFRELPFYKQVVGIGSGAFNDFFASYNVDRVTKFVDPHSEFLYYLVSMGIVGVIGYFGMIVTAIVECVRNGKTTGIILAAVFVSWIAQGTVNNPLVFTTPYLFLFLAMSRFELKYNKE